MSDHPDILVALRGYSLVRETATGPRTLLRDLDLTLRRGEWLAVAGANGSGKTSLLRWLAGEGSPLRGACALVFQDPDEPLVAATVGEELALGRPGLDPAPLLQEHGLAAMADVDPRCLSAGEQQRLSWAVAEAGLPAVLLCDEPTALQDDAHAAWLLARLGDWRARTGGTILFATQRRAEALLADRLLVLAEGRIVADGPPSALADRPPARDLLAPPFPDPAAGPARVTARGGAAAVVVARWEGVACRPGKGRGFRGVSLELRAGDRIGITGPSGAGKSTLLACAAGLRAPDAGRCVLGGRPLCARGAPDLAHGLALLAPQFPEHLFTRARVTAEVALDPALGWAGSAGVLAAAGLPAAAGERDPHDLSSGERRRLAVALVVLSGRPLLLLDEPTAGLDREGARSVARLLRTVPSDAAVVVASHDPVFLAACGCRLFVLGPDGLGSGV